MKYREQRRPIDRKITLNTPEGRVSVKLRDISTSGMKVSGVSLPMDTQVFVPIIGQDLKTHVVFADGDSLGLRFDTPLSKAQVTAIISPGWSSGVAQVQRFREM